MLKESSYEISLMLALIYNESLAQGTVPGDRRQANAAPGFSPPEPASVGPCVRVSVHSCVNTFKHEYLRNQKADHQHILSEAPLGWGERLH